MKFTNINQSKNYSESIKDALEKYSINYSEITFLQASENITFSIKNENSNKKYLLRIHGSDDKNSINSELLLLEHINTHNVLKVQSPIRTTAGDLVITCYCQELERDVHISLLQWIQGKNIDINSTEYEGIPFNLGIAMGRFHKHLSTSNLPKDLKIPEYTLQGFKTNISKLQNLVSMELLAPEQYEFIRKSALDLIDYIHTNLPQKDNWGVIHADLNEGNYILDNVEIFFIDFSRSGFGYYLYDMAECLMHLSSHNRKDFIRGYKDVHPLPNGYNKLIECFFILAIIDGMLFQSSDPLEHDHVKRLGRVIHNNLLVKIANDTRFI